MSRSIKEVSSVPQGWRSPRTPKSSTALASWDTGLPVLNGGALAVEQAPDHTQRSSSLVGSLWFGQVGQTIDRLEMPLVRRHQGLGHNGDVEGGVGVLGVAHPLHAGAEGAASGGSSFRIGR